MQSYKSKERLGQILIQMGKLNAEQLQIALEKSVKDNDRIGRTLISLGVCDEESIAMALATQYGTQYVQMQEQRLDKKTSQQMPENFAREHNTFLISLENNVAVVATDDPGNLIAVEATENLLSPANIKWTTVSQEQLLVALDQIYQKKEALELLAGEVSKDIGEGSIDLDLGDLSNEDVPIAKLLQKLFQEAIATRASDIHFEPQEKKLLIRFRVDGLLRVQSEAESRIANAVALRLKLLARLDISEKRLPQDGRFQARIHQQPIDFRLSTAPTTHGEMLVIRILRPQIDFFDFAKLGMNQFQQTQIYQTLNKSSGMILVTGPTGAGKTTTLYSLLHHINKPDIKIITVEDPIEYRLDGVCQIQIQEKIDLTFARALRSILRQDPDAILIGEMRDYETMDAAIKASMTGHLVLSSLHTNDAATVPFRLLDMGAKHYQVASSLKLVIAQRLVRLSCPHCKTKRDATPQEAAWLAHQTGATETSANTAIFESVGCELCQYTKWMGRVAIYEMLWLDYPMTQALLSQNLELLRELVNKQLVNKTLGYQVAHLVLSGKTTPAEAQKISAMSDFILE